MPVRSLPERSMPREKEFLPPPIPPSDCIYMYMHVSVVYKHSCIVHAQTCMHFALLQVYKQLHALHTYMYTGPALLYT